MSDVNANPNDLNTAREGGTVVGDAAANAVLKNHQANLEKADAIKEEGHQAAQDKRAEGAASAAETSTHAHEMGDSIRNAPGKAADAIHNVVQTIYNATTKVVDAIKAVPGQVADGVAGGVATVVEKTGDTAAHLKEKVADKKADSIEKHADKDAQKVIDHSHKDDAKIKAKVVAEAVDAGERAYEEDMAHADLVGENVPPTDHVDL